MVKRPTASFSLRTLRAFLLVSVSVVTYAALALPLSLRPPALPLQVGDVSPQIMQAPRSLQYVSQVRTQDAQDAAEKAVLPVYTPPDPAIARKQIDQLNSTLQTISLIRLDTTTTTDQKESVLAALNGITLSADAIQQILEMSDSRWSAVQQESVRVLEQVMRTPVRADNLDFVKKDVSSHRQFDVERAGRCACHTTGRRLCGSQQPVQPGPDDCRTAGCARCGAARGAVV